jgi:hypothetical protein
MAASPNIFLEPILLTLMPVRAPDDDTNDDRVPIDDIPPALLPLDALVPIFELLRLVLVPAVLNKLPFVDIDGVEPKGGMGDLAREMR